jgi:hypothetical protein
MLGSRQARTILALLELAALLASLLAVALAVDLASGRTALSSSERHQVAELAGLEVLAATLLLHTTNSGVGPQPSSLEQAALHLHTAAQGVALGARFSGTALARFALT